MLEITSNQRHMCTRSRIRTNNQESDKFVISMDFRQDSILNPLLFIILMDEIAKKCQTKCSNVSGSKKPTANRFVGVNLCERPSDYRITKNSLQIHIEGVSKFAMKINVHKTKILNIYYGRN